MKLYASIHGVCGLAEGYSDTTVQFFKTLEQAKEHKNRILDLLMKEEVEAIESNRGFSGGLAVESLSDGTQDIITMNEDECEQEILKIVEVNPTWDTDNGESEVANNSTPEFLMWNQMDCEVMYDGEYLPTDMGCIKEATDALYGVSESMLMEAWADFVGGIYYQRDTMLDADDVCIHFFRIPKSDTL
tara:strand:- start:231 stop:794 length:564 start_codon:yes stop_codon:yes gene_type:complete